MPFISALVGIVGGAISAVGSFVAPLLGGAGFLGGIGKALLVTGLNVAMQYAQKAFQKKQATPPSGTDLDLQFGEGGSRKVMCGRCAVAGHFNYANAYGEANGSLQQVFTLSDFPCTSLDKVYVDGELATFGPEDPVLGLPLTSGEYAGQVWFKFKDGWQSTAEILLTGNATPVGRWKTTAVGLGIAYVVATMNYDREKLTQPPQFLFEFSGAPLYDWRKDSTVGGSGTHRWNDTTTWEFSENPILMAYAYHRGIAFNGDMFCGMEVEAFDLPLSKWTLAANICDELVESEPRYRCSIGLDCNVEHGDNIDQIMTACGGMMANSVGEIFPVVGADQAAALIITDADLIVGAPVTYQVRRAMSDLVNSVSGTYPNPDNQWSASGYQTATDSGTVSADRITRDVSINFETVPYPKQAARLAALYFSENRFEATATITLRPRFQVLEPGVDWITWTSARYGTRTFMVVDMQIVSDSEDGPRNVVVSLQERSGTIYNSVGVTLPLLPLGPATPVYASELQDFAVTASNGVGTDNRIYPIIRAAWSAPTDPTISGVTLQWRPKAQPEVVFEKAVSRDRMVAILTEGVVSVTEYEVRHILITDPARPVVATAWVEVTTLDTPMTDILVTLAEIDRDVSETFKRLSGDMNDFRARLTDLSTSVQLAGMANYQTVSTVTARVDNAEASIVTEQDVRAAADAAIAAQLVTFSASIDENSSLITQETVARTNADSAITASIVALQAVVGGNTASILSESIARADGDSANATLINGVNADYNGRFASGLMKFEARSAPAGVDARFSVMLRAGTGDAYKEAGFYMDLKTVFGVQRSEFAILADRFVVTDGTYSNLPMAYVGGVLKLQNLAVSGALIEDATIGGAKIADAAITSAKIGNLQVGTSNLDYDVVTGRGSIGPTFTIATVSNAWTTIASLAIDNVNPSNVLMEVSLAFEANTGPTGTTFKVRLKRVYDGKVCVLLEDVANANSGLFGSLVRNFYMDDDSVAGGAILYVVEYYQDTGRSVDWVTSHVKMTWSRR